ncbi:Elongation of very long chain fatty acids protein 7 [Holothuria leucospilota]|uniref:Elongation of very long chain fatty acids protein n=1 Tax=Holothuria leucospilota TaxID=206669 RepID=A0A9Q1C909_HOLLE|nr:Elongation of very long chain fatty acids protein 7 [Holothuria leucospilota]
MAAVVRWWDDIIETYSDPRTEDWLFMQSPVPGTLLVILYLIIVWIGPKLMANREPFNLKPLLIVYNFAMVGLSFYMFWEFNMAGWLAGYTLGCQLVDYSRSPQALRMASVCWLFYISKFIEMLDTIFFILRKKNKQISFLHVFHHAIMPFTWWIGVKFVPGGFGTFHSMLNSFIHVLMYVYYGLAACGPSMQKFLWWKKYMTTMQLIQFFLVMTHSGQLFFIECPYPKVFAWIIGLYGFIFFFLFLNFYVQAYRKSGSKPTKENGHQSNGVKDNKTKTH